MSKFYWPRPRAATFPSHKTALFPGTNCSSFVANDARWAERRTDSNRHASRGGNSAAGMPIFKFRLKIG
ncbi:MAG: hypothetical protein J0I68_15980 [Achromobacter sp.]|uniref:hypothetical protein n=1 Tax=Achromobacter TaxID=222 RepID=UPI0012E1432D|nr:MULTISPECIES: hypothetical protein [Achromobacter]MBN9640042.1 hypothetical protein [Achromobacter sp.]